MRRVVAGRSGHSSAGMRAGSAQVQPFDRRAILRPTGHRAHEEKLLERKIAVKNIALGEAVGAFQIEGRENLSRHD